MSKIKDEKVKKINVWIRTIIFKRPKKRKSKIVQKILKKIIRVM